MDDTSDNSSKQKSDSICTSQDLLDSSSTSSLSVFADQSESNQVQEGAQRSTKTSMNEALKSEKAFIEFVMSFPPNDPTVRQRPDDNFPTRSKGPATGSAATKVGLDHLDNLCKLMEQLSELKDTNNKLQKRVQYLEDMKTLHEVHKEICKEGPCTSEDTKQERPYGLQKSATESHCPTGDKSESVPCPNRSPSRYLSRRSRVLRQGGAGPRRERSKSVGHEDMQLGDTKSKRIFPKWSRVKEAFGWESERKDSAKLKADSEALQTSRRSSDESHRHGHSPIWYQDVPSLYSSFGDVHDVIHPGTWKRASLVSEKCMGFLDTPPEGLRRQKSSPSPGSDKSGFREVTDMKPKYSTIERDSYRTQDLSKLDKEDCKRGKGPWGRVKTIIERRRDSLKRKSVRRDGQEGDSNTGKKTSENPDVVDYPDYDDPSPKPSKQMGTKAGSIPLDHEVEYSGPRTPNSSPTFHRKSRWTRVKKVLKGRKEDDPLSLSTPASPNGQQDSHFTFDAIEELSQDSYGDDYQVSRGGSDGYVHQLALSSPNSDLMLQLQRNLSEDFHRKIQEWERKRGSGRTSCSPHWERKPSGRKKSEREDKTIKTKIKDLGWLEKELQKIEKEKQRLSKEREKYEERALRLLKLKETVLSNKKEVLVRTSAGEFRFEGISDAFTKKLYEWETKKGVGPELSTIALLDSSRLTVQSPLGSKAGTLQRVLSRSESSIADIGQPSHNSSNSLPSVKLADSFETDRQNHASRANSEPDLSTLTAFTNGINISRAPLCSEENMDEDEGAKDSEEGDLRRKGSYYGGLLEENVLLLDQLKRKEEICRNLQEELHLLDEKVDVMTTQHTQETERYREKLWEMHQQGASPRDVQSCLQAMSQLSRRIETLEACTERIRSDRETIEDSYLFHSKQQETMTLDLLGKMRELQAAGSTTAETESKNLGGVDAGTVERLQDLSALLIKQTQELEDTLSEKSRQVSQLRWELLHRDLSSVKRDVHATSSNLLLKGRRNKYAQWRSRSNEETPRQIPESAYDPVVSSEIYCTKTPSKEFKAIQLTSTVQQLSKEVLKLTSASECLPDDRLCANTTPVNKKVESSRLQKTVRSIKDHPKKITVRRSSADNLSLATKNEDRRGDESSTNSEDSSDEYFTRVPLRQNLKNGLASNNDAERLLMSYGENPPRTYPQKKKKLQRTSKMNSSPNRKRSNTFHTNRDLAKPIMGENAPQKCHSFRETRRLEDSIKQNMTDLNELINNLKQVDTPPEISRNRIKPTISLSHRKSFEKAVENGSNKLVMEVAPDSKIPLMMQVQKSTVESVENQNDNKTAMTPSSDKDTTRERKEHLQKKRLKKRLKSPESSFLLKVPIDSSSNTNSSEDLLQRQSVKPLETRSNTTKSFPKDDGLKSSTNEVFKSHVPNQIPTITIQLPKRKQKRVLHSGDRTNAELSFTIAMPKKRSLSSDQESSSISESSSREILKMSYSEKSSDSLESPIRKNPATYSIADSRLHPSESKPNESNERIQLMKLVSLDNFESPFDPNDTLVKSAKNKFADENDNSIAYSSESKSDLIPVSPELNTTHSNNTNKSVTVEIQCDIGDTLSTETNYIKSPSAPQLDWRRICAKKISKEGAPNVRTLIEIYNQRVIENGTCKSPYSSNVSSPVTPRKISTPIKNSDKLQDSVLHSFSTPNTPAILSSSCSPLALSSMRHNLLPKSPPASPMSVARSEALRKAREQFIASPPSSPLLQRKFGKQPDNKSELSKSRSYSTRGSDQWGGSNHKNPKSEAKKTVDFTKPEEDTVSNSSMDSMSMVMIRAGESCRESRFPKRLSENQKDDNTNLKTSKSLSNSSLFRSVLGADFRMPTNFMKLKRSRRKDMNTVSQLCRQSLLLTSEEANSIPCPASHKSCPSSPELKPKGVVKSSTSWFHRNIFKHK